MKLLLLIAMLAPSWTLLAEEAPGPVMQRQVTLASDGPTGASAANLIYKAFGKNAIESPDLYPNNHPKFAHIKEINDPKVGNCFVFYLHRDLDGDRDKPLKSGDRQRNEIKGSVHSNDTLKATHGQVVRYRWLFRINPKMTVSKGFCHFFQLKQVGGRDEGTPIFTISGTVSEGKPRLEGRYRRTEKSKIELVNICDWDDALDKWLDCECITKFHDDGYLRLIVRDLKKNVLLDKEIRSIDTWRTDTSFVRPKWGIYRSLIDKKSIANEEDIVLFANFRIQEWSDIPPHPKPVKRLRKSE